MSVDFKVNVNVEPHGKEKIDELERQIERLKSETVRINFDVDGTDGIEKAFKSMNAQMQRQAVSYGKNYQKSFNKGAKSVGTTATDYAKERVRQQKEVEKIAKNMEKHVPEIAKPTPYDSDVDKNALREAENYHKQQLKIEEKAAREYQKIQDQKIKQSRKNQSAIDKVNAKQSFAQYQQRATDKNAHNKLLVDSGKQMLENYKSKREQQRKIDIQAEKEHIKQIEKQSKKAASAESKISTSQRIGQYQQRAIDKNAHTQELVGSVKQFYENKKAEIAEKKRIQEQNKETESHIKNKFETGKYSALKTRMQSQLDSYRNQPSNSYLDNAKSSYDSYNKSLDRINSHFSGKYTLTTDTLKSEFENLEKASTSFKNSISEVGDTMSKTLDNSVFQQRTNEVEKYFDRNIDAAKEYKKEFKDLQDLYLSASTKEDKDMLDDEFERLKYKTSEKQKALNKQIQEEKRAEKQRLDEENRIAKENEKRKTDVKYDIETGKYSALKTRMQSQLDKYSGQDNLSLNKASEAMKDFDDEFAKLKSHIDGTKTLSDDEFNSAFDKMSKSIDTFKNKMSEVGNTMSKSLDPGIAERGANKVAAYYEENSKAVKKYGAELKDLENRYRTMTTQEEKSRYDNEFSNLKSKISAEGLTGKSHFQELNRAMKQIGEFVGIYGIIQNVAMEIPSKIFTAVKDVNAAQIELTKVSNASQGQLNKYWDEASVSAKKYGSTISDVISNTADWSRLGYGLDDAKKLSDATTLLQRVGDNMTQESSSKGMISTLKGFNLDAEEAMSIIDKVNEVANTQPIDTSGLFAGLERSASSMSAANNSLDQTIALITAANSVVQDPDSIGTAFKTISMRIRGASTEMEEAGLDTEGMAESTAKLREEILALSGVDIMKNENEFKSTYDILDELSIKWSELSDISQASITELVAGKRQGNIMSALMSNFDIARETLNTAMTESSGSAEKELTNYQKGIEYSLDKFKATFQDFSTSLLDSNMVKGFVDTGSSLLGGFTNIIDGIGVIQTIAGGFGAYKGISSFVKNFDSPEIMGTVNFRYLHSESGIV